MVQIMHFSWCYFGQMCIRFAANLAPYRNKKYAGEIHFIETNLVSNITGIPEYRNTSVGEII